jgi:hypothetical protein
MLRNIIAIKAAKQAPTIISRDILVPAMAFGRVDD